MKSVRAKLLVGACATLAAAFAFAADVGGTWTVTTESPRGNRDATITLTQKGEALTGSMKTPRGEAPISGTLKGNAIAFSYKMALQGNEMEVKYSGTVDGNAMSGTVDMGGRGEAKFTGKKQ